MEDLKNRWNLFNSIIDDENLNYKEKCLLLIIFRYINCGTGYANPSRKRIKKLTGIVDNRTLDNLFDSLISEGYLAREKGFSRNSRYYIKTGNFTPEAAEVTPKLSVNITPQKENKRIQKNIYKDLTFIDDSITDVYLTEEAYKRLAHLYGIDLICGKIIDLENFIVNGKGIKYKDHYRVLLAWCRKDMNKSSKFPEEKVYKLKELN